MRRARERRGGKREDEILEKPLMLVLALGIVACLRGEAALTSIMNESSCWWRTELKAD